MDVQDFRMDTSAIRLRCKIKKNLNRNRFGSSTCCRFVLSLMCVFFFFYSVQIEDVISGKKKHPHVHPCASEAGLPPLRQWCFSVNSVIKPALLLIQRWGGREREGENMLRGHGIVKTGRAPANTSLAGFEMKRTSRQLCNMSRRRGDGQRYREGGGGGGRRADPCAC